MTTKTKNALQPTSGLAAGGVLARGTLYRHFGSSPPVQAFVNPRPTAKPPGVGCNACAKFSWYFAQRDLTTWCKIRRTLALLTLTIE